MPNKLLLLAITLKNSKVARYKLQIILRYSSQVVTAILVAQKESKEGQNGHGLGGKVLEVLNLVLLCNVTLKL